MKKLPREIIQYILEIKWNNHLNAVFEKYQAAITIFDLEDLVDFRYELYVVLGCTRRICSFCSEIVEDVRWCVCKNCIYEFNNVCK